MTEDDGRTFAMGGPPPGGTTPRINAGRLWSSGVATAVVAALVGFVGVLVARVLFRVAFSGEASAGAIGDGNTAFLCAVAALAALAATGLAHLLLISTPRPLAYLGWIIGLVTAIAVVLPFLSTRSLGVSATQAVINLVIGMAIGSLVTGAAASTLRASRVRTQDY
ncbi:MAG: hypothetical protein H0X35_08125 [Pseudonocardiales bacterium]|nr:hypothetical protein [Pseudonocardiales bacterium]